MVDNIEIHFKCAVMPAKLILNEILNSIEQFNIRWDEIYVNLPLDDIITYHQTIEEAANDFIDNLGSLEHYLHCKEKFDGNRINKLLIKNIGKEGLYIKFVYKGPNFTLEQFHYYEQFFYNIYQSLDSKIYYKSFVGVASKNKFYRENGLLDINFYNAPFLEESFCYRCLTPKSVYAEWHTKEQLLQAPFYSIKELANETLEIIQFEHPIDITNTQHIENMHSLQTYLSQHNTYPEDL